MADNPLVVALLKEYRDEASISKTEVGRIIGKNRNEVAGIWMRNKDAIGKWPLIPKSVARNRSCQFPIGSPGESDFHLCGKRKDAGHSFLCTEHRTTIWKPECKVISMGK